MLPCFSKQIFGFDCLGCGLQRSAVFLFQGDFAAAWHMYPAIFAIIPLFVFLASNSFFTIKYANKIVITLMVASVGLILTNYILKFI
jgi:hypothetical protein